MQSTSALYKSIVSKDSHWFENMLVINGNNVNEDKIMSISRDRCGMPENKPSVGGAIASTMEFVVVKPMFEIPRQAEILVKIRAKSGTQVSEWLPAGTYFIDTRSYDETANGIEFLKITAFDSMAKAEADYPDTSHAWPHLDKSVVAEIATAMGVTVDPRTNSLMTAGHMIDIPIGSTMREKLGNIASMYCGNFVVTAENKLLLVPLYGLDPDVNGRYLADESGNALVFGNEGWCILV